MQPAPSQDITALLHGWNAGNNEALEHLMPVVMRELRKLAGSYLRSERRNHTLQPTALINEAYMRLVAQDCPEWKSRTHFFGVAAQLMRQILVDHARAHLAVKRGDAAPKLSLEEAAEFSRAQASDLVALDDALLSLTQLDKRKARVVELRYFGGLTAEEIAQVLDISTATVTREMRMAHVWLQREMQR